MILIGITAYLQTLDTTIKKPFEDHLHMEINEFTENRMERNQYGNSIKSTRTLQLYNRS